MRILFFTHYYPPEVNAPASRTSEHCREWVRRGHEPTVVTCVPNHPAGKIYPGYNNKLYQTEMRDGVKVVRLWTFLAANEGFLFRTLNYVAYMVVATLALPFLPKADVVVSTSPQFFCGLTGFAARLVKRAPWVLEIRDLWPESIATVGVMKRGATISALEAVEAFAYRQADRMVSVTNSFVPHIEARGGAGKVAVIKNGVDLTLFTSAASGEDIKKRFDLEGRFVAAYVGTHGMAHGLDTILDAAQLLKDDPRIGLLLVGDGAERKRLQERVETLKLDNIRVVGQLPKSDMPAVWAATDASLILLRKSDAFKKVIPSKMFEAMAMERPIVLGVEGEARELLESADAGMAIEPESAEELAAAVKKLAADPELCASYGRRGLAHVREHYDRAKLAARYLDLLEDAVARSGRSS